MPGIQEGSGGLAYARLEVVASTARMRRIRPPREVASDEDETGRRIMLSPDTPDGGAVKRYRETKWKFSISRYTGLKVACQFSDAEFYERGHLFSDDRGF